MEYNKIAEINKIIDSGEYPIHLETDELQQILKKPLSRARYNAAVHKKIRKPRISIHNHIICDVCKGSYTQSNVSHHRKSKHHLFCEQLNNKWLSMLYD